MFWNHPPSYAYVRVHLKEKEQSKQVSLDSMDLFTLQELETAVADVWKTSPGSVVSFEVNTYDLCSCFSRNRKTQMEVHCRRKSKDSHSPVRCPIPESYVRKQKDKTHTVKLRMRMRTHMRIFEISFEAVPANFLWFN